MDGAVNLKQQKKPVLPRMKKYAGFYVLFLPVLAFLVVFHYLPMFGIYYSFTKYTIIKSGWRILSGCLPCRISGMPSRTRWN